MTARNKAGQEGFDQEIERLRTLGWEAEHADNFDLAARYYQHALDLIEESGADTSLRPVLEDALRRARAKLPREHRLLY